MRSSKLIGGLVAAVAMLSATASAGAATTLPELGRCVKLTKVNGKYAGHYKAANCVAVSPTNTGTYEFLPGPGPHNKFTATSAEPEPVLETTGLAKVACSSISVTGEYTGPKSLKATKVLLKGCAAGGRPCQTLPVAHEGEIEGTGELEGTLGAISGGLTPTVGWDYKRAAGGPLFAFTCGKFPEVASTQTIEGSVIGQVFGGRESNLNRMYIKSLTKFKQKFGFQNPESFEGAPKDVLTTTTMTGTAKTVEQTGLTGNVPAVSGLGNAVEDPKNQEALEIKAK